MFKYIWDDFDCKIVLPALKQSQDGCTFAAVARQTEYSIRIGYAEVKTPILSPLPIIGNKEWERYIKRCVLPGEDNWWPHRLLTYVLCEDVHNPHGEHRSAIAYARTLAPHWSDETHLISHLELTNQKIKDLIYQRIPLVAVIFITTGYPERSQTPYILHSPEEIEIRPKELRTHAVVIVGLYEAEEHNPFGIAKGIYWLYQSSFPEWEENMEGFLGNGISILDPRLVYEISYGVSYPACVFLDADTPQAEKIAAYHRNKNTLRRQHRDAYFELQRRLRSQ